MIEKNCWSGLEDFYVSLGKSLHLEEEEALTTVHGINKVSDRSRARINRPCVNDRRPNRGRHLDIYSSNNSHFVVRSFEKNNKMTKEKLYK